LVLVYFVSQLLKSCSGYNFKWQIILIGKDPIPSLINILLSLGFQSAVRHNIVDTIDSMIDAEIEEIIANTGNHLPDCADL
jgi:hypothetical protein